MENAVLQECTFSDSAKFDKEEKEEGQEVRKKDEDDDLPLFEKLERVKMKSIWRRCFSSKKRNQNLCPKMLAKLTSLKEGLLT